jgi:hypothetical protein
MDRYMQSAKKEAESARPKAKTNKNRRSPNSKTVTQQDLGDAGYD